MENNIDNTREPAPATVRVSELSNQELINLKAILEARIEVIIRELRKRIQT